MAQMSTLMLVATTLSVVNIVLLAALTFIWGRNYRTFRTPLILGLLIFGAVLLIENVAAVYFFFSTKMLYSGDPGIDSAVTILRALQTVALVSLTYVTTR